MTFGNVTVIENVPTPLKIRMHDMQQGTSTEITYSEVDYDVDIPNIFFDPQHLPQTVEARFWQQDSPIAAKKE